MPFMGLNLQSSASSVNDAGLIVGTVNNLSGKGTTGTLAYLSDGHMAWDLNTLIPPTSGLTLTDAFDINDLG